MLKKLIYNKYFILYFVGLISALAFAPTYLFPILFLVFYIVLKDLEKAKDKKESFLIGWFFAFGHFMGGCYWICISLLVDPIKFAWLIPFAISIIPAILALFIGISSLLYYLIRKRFDIKNKFLLTIVFAFLFMLSEILRANFFIPFIWNPIGNIWCFSDIMIQFDYITKIYIFSFITVLLFSSFYVFFDFEDKKISFKIRKNYVYLTFYIILFLTMFFYGYFRLRNTNSNNNGKVVIRVVQPNIKQDLKWDKVKAHENIKNLIGLSNEGEKADYIVWPESSIPFFVSNGSIFLDIHQRLKNKDVILISGAVRVELFNNELKNIWNSAFISKNGMILDYYDKIDLVPFGEYIPLRKFLPFVSKITGGSIDFSSGKERNVIRIDDFLQKSIFLICYEIVFPNLKYNEKPDIIFNLTNDAWFGRSSGPFQHLDHTKMRAVENNVKIFRAANSGVSAYIDNYGRVKKKLSLNSRNYFDVSIDK